MANSPTSRDSAVVAWQEIWPHRFLLCSLDLVSQSIISNNLIENPRFLTSTLYEIWLGLGLSYKPHFVLNSTPEELHPTNCTLTTSCSVEYQHAFNVVVPSLLPSQFLLGISHEHSLPTMPADMILSTGQRGR